MLMMRALSVPDPARAPDDTHDACVRAAGEVKHLVEQHDLCRLEICSMINAGDIRCTRIAGSHIQTSSPPLRLNLNPCLSVDRLLKQSCRRDGM